MKPLAITLAALMLSPVYAQDRHEYQFANISGNRIAYSCVGEGDITAVLISGMGLSSHQSFGNTFHRFKGPGRLCLYDRAELGASRAVNERPRSVTQIAEELHALATITGWSKPMLIAHSFGGYIARAYAAKFPNELSAIIFVDCAHEGWLPALRDRMSDDDWARMQKAVDWQLKSTHEDYMLAQHEVETFNKLGALPITVISRGLPQTNVRLGGMTYEGVDIFNAEHAKLQSRLAALSESSRHVRAKYASHIVDETDPWLILDEIAGMQKRIVAASSSHRD
jgi:pimeloyl-ACP methyl ester carboxylesterase